MQSKTSFFNFTLFRKDLSRFWPLWGMVSFVGALFPLALWLSRGQANSAYPITPMEMADAYYTVVAHFLPVASLIYAVLCAMLVWSYLYNTRSVGLMHALPIRREGLFCTHFLSGMAMMLIPYAITGALCVLVSAVCGGFSWGPLLNTIAAVAGESFFYFAAATLVAFVTGNVFALPVLYLGLHFLAPALDLLVSMMARGFLFGFRNSYSGALEFLSPTVYLMEHVTMDRVREYTTQVDIYTGGTYQDYVTTAVNLEGLGIVGIYALVGVVCVILAWLLYRCRCSETAGDVVAVGWMKPVFRFGVAALAALGGGLLLYMMLWENFYGGDRYAVIPLVVCMIVAGAIGYYAASMLLAKSLKVFRGNWKGMALVAVGCIVVCCALRFDLLGVAKSVPETSQVESVLLYVGGNTYNFYPGEDDELLEQVRTVHKAIVADEDYIQTVSDAYWNGEYVEDENVSGYNYLRLEYNLTSGRTVTRVYGVPMTRDRIAQEGTYDQLLDSLVNGQEMKNRRLHAGDARYAIEGGYIYLYYGSYSDFDLNTQQAATLAEAVMQDCAEGTWGTCDWFDRDDSDAYAMDIELSYNCCLDGDTQYNDWIYITVRPGMANTVNCLKELGLVTNEDLVTYAERDDEETEAEIYEEAAESTIIGGGDERTTIVVTTA